MVKIVPRGFTTCAAAYLTPLIRNYIQGWTAFVLHVYHDILISLGFTAGFSDHLANCSVLFMQSDGGLVPGSQFDGARAVLSGPAGGVVGFSTTAYREHKQPVIGFDMGGTSTDVWLLVRGLTTGLALRRRVRARV
jgi:5-oxoprolinase (ATP-hydrolysing)